jgi:hypothetical protein
MIVYRFALLLNCCLAFHGGLGIHNVNLRLQHLEHSKVGDVRIVQVPRIQLFHD